MTCQDVRYQLADYLDKKLIQRDEALVSSHLVSCEHCRAEVRELQSLFLALGEEQPQSPSPLYWTALPVRIRQRIDEQSRNVIPEWIARLALPVASAIVLVIAVIGLAPRHAPDESRELADILQQFAFEEVQQAAERQTYIGVLEPAATSEYASSSVYDKDVLGEFLKGQEQVSHFSSIDPESTVKDLGSQDVEEFVSILEKNFSSN